MELRRLKCLYSDVHIHAKVMGTLVYLICIAVASFAVLAQPAVAQGVTYPSQVLQGDGSQTYTQSSRKRE